MLCFAHLECCISSHSHRAKLIIRQFRAAITWYRQSTTEADWKSTAQIRVTNATANLVSFSIFIFSCTKKKTSVSCSIYPSSMLPSCKKNQTTLHPSKISISFQKITSDAFGLAFGILSIFATFTLFGVSRTRILWECVVETHLTPLIPNQNKTNNAQKKVEYISIFGYWWFWWTLDYLEYDFNRLILISPALGCEFRNQWMPLQKHQKLAHATCSMTNVEKLLVFLALITFKFIPCLPMILPMSVHRTFGGHEIIKDQDC